MARGLSKTPKFQRALSHHLPAYPVLQMLSLWTVWGCHQPGHVRARDSETEREIIGARQIFVQNCHRDGYPLRLIVNDLTDGTSEDLGELSGGYDDWGGCAGEVETIELTDAHVYLITGFYEDDPLAPGVPHIRAVLGDSDGIDGWWSMTGSGW